MILERLLNLRLTAKVNIVDNHQVLIQLRETAINNKVYRAFSLLTKHMHKDLWVARSTKTKVVNNKRPFGFDQTLADYTISRLVSNIESSYVKNPERAAKIMIEVALDSRIMCSDEAKRALLEGGGSWVYPKFIHSSKFKKLIFDMANSKDNELKEQTRYTFVRWMLAPTTAECYQVALEEVHNQKWIFDMILNKLINSSDHDSDLYKIAKFVLDCGVKNATNKFIEIYPNLGLATRAQLGDLFIKSNFDGASDVLIKSFQEFRKSSHYDSVGITFIDLLMGLGDLSAAEPIIDYMFSIKDLRILNDYVSKNLALFEKYYRDYSQLILDTVGFGIKESPEKTVEILCKVKSPISNNLLHKVKEKREVILGASSEEISPDWVATSYFREDFSKPRSLAKKELSHRGNPKYDSSVYLIENNWKIDKNIWN